MSEGLEVWILSGSGFCLGAHLRRHACLDAQLPWLFDHTCHELDTFNLWTLNPRSAKAAREAALKAFQDAEVKAKAAADAASKAKTEAESKLVQEKAAREQALAAAKAIAETA